MLVFSRPARRRRGCPAEMDVLRCEKPFFWPARLISLRDQKVRLQAWGWGSPAGRAPALPTVRWPEGSRALNCVRYGSGVVDAKNGNGAAGCVKRRKRCWFDLDGASSLKLRFQRRRIVRLEDGLVTRHRWGECRLSASVVQYGLSTSPPSAASSISLLNSRVWADGASARARSPHKGAGLCHV